MTSIKFLFSFKVKMIQGQIIMNNTARLALMFWHINTFIMKGSAKWRKEENAFQDIRPLEINQSFQLHLHSQQLWRWWDINTPPDTSSSDTLLRGTGGNLKISSKLSRLNLVKSMQNWKLRRRYLWVWRA